MTVAREIPLSFIDVPAGRRKVSPDWIEALAADIERQGLRVPVLLVETGERFRLVAGAHRLAAAKALKWKTIPAEAKPAEAFADDAALKLAEIAENLMRRELSALDRAMDVAAWREIYEQAQGAVKRGGDQRRRSKFHDETLNDADPLAVAAERFAETFGEAARRALGLSKVTVWRCLKIATLDEETRERVALTPVAESQTDLMALADADAETRHKALDLLFADEAGSVSEALAKIAGHKPDDPTEKAYRSIADKWRRLPARWRRNFIRTHRDEIVALLKEEGAL